MKIIISALIIIGFALYIVAIISLLAVPVCLSFTVSPYFIFLELAAFPLSIFFILFINNFNTKGQQK